MKLKLAALAMALSLPLYALKLSDLPDKSYSLEGIVDDTKSEPFACSFGHYTVKVKSQTAKGTKATLIGGGILLNSGFLHTSIGNGPGNPEPIVYIFPATAKIKDGDALSAYCNDNYKPGLANITYFVREK